MTMENNAERRQTRAMTEAQRMEEEAGREVVRSFRMDASRELHWLLDAGLLPQTHNKDSKRECLPSEVEQFIYLTNKTQ